MDWLDYREVLEIDFDDNGRRKLFMTKMFNALHVLEPDFLLELVEYYNFCNETGTAFQSNLFRSECFTSVIDTLRSYYDNLKEFLAYYVAFINCQAEHENREVNKQYFKNLILNCLSEAHILYEVLEDEKGFFVFPKGVETFDDELVSKPLRWLKKYPIQRRKEPGARH